MSPLSLPDRMRAAADTLREVSALYGYCGVDHVKWCPAELLIEAGYVAADYPTDSSAFEPASAGIGSADGARPAQVDPPPGAGRASTKPHN